MSLISIINRASRVLLFFHCSSFACDSFLFFLFFILGLSLHLDLSVLDYVPLSFTKFGCFVFLVFNISTTFILFIWTEIHTVLAVFDLCSYWILACSRLLRSGILRNMEGFLFFKILVIFAILGLCRYAMAKECTNILTNESRNTLQFTLSNFKPRTHALCKMIILWWFYYLLFLQFKLI